MYLTSAYEYMIEWQNDFINLIINNNKNDGILSKYISLLEQEINVQEAKSNEIINIDENVFNKFYNLLLANLMRKSLLADKKDTLNKFKDINFEYSFDFNFIEEELGKLILPGIKKFKKKIHFMTYLFENFQDEKSNLIINYI